MRRPVLIAHADWSTKPEKRWIATGRLSGSTYALGAPQPVGDVASLLRRLSESAGGGSLVAGFDFPLGLPLSFAERAQISRFPDFLPVLGKGEWKNFYEIAASPGDISFHRPFYPKRPGGTAQSYLARALGVSSMHDLLRLCERQTANRNNACALFWTLGANQVGRGAITGWRDMLTPALLDKNIDLAIWPFKGSLDELVANRRCTVVETYPAEACLHLGMLPPGRGWSKQSQHDRKAQCTHLLNWASSRGVVIEDKLMGEICSGFSGGDDPFDAVVGLMSMAEVILGHRSDGAPQLSSVRNIEGWIFGQRTA